MRAVTILGQCAVVVATSLFVARALALGPAISVLVNQKNGVASLSASDLKRVVTGVTKVWPGGAVVQLGIIPGEAPETQGLAAFLETSPRELMSALQQQVFKGELRRPTMLRSSADCVALALSNPGAICIAVAGTAVPEGARVVPVR